MDELLFRIVEICLRLDRQATDVYRRLASITVDGDLAAFWEEMSKQESDHVVFWEKLLEAVEAGEIPQIFPLPEKTLRELTEKHDRAEKLIGSGRYPADPAGQFLLAFQLEFYLLHPSLDKLWHFYTIMKPGESSPEKDYDAHIRGFIEAMRTFCTASPELELLGESLMQMWLQVRELTQETEVDVLTRVLNRRGLFNGMKVLAQLALRNEFTSGMLLVDIDHFKVVNDRFGHQVGDAVLAEVAGIIAGQVRRSDVVGRYGGEEFLVFLPQVEGQNITDLAEKIRSTVEREMEGHHRTTISIGAACAAFSDDVEGELERLIRKADGCLYQAKAEGRNKVISKPCPN